jgi:CBS domain-containing protein
MRNRKGGNRGMDLDQGRFETERDRERPSRQNDYQEYDYDDRGRATSWSSSGQPHYRKEYDRDSPDTAYREGNWDSPYNDRDWTAREHERDYSPGVRRSHLRIRDIMTRNVVTCRRNTPIQEAARLMRDEDIGAVPVIDDTSRLEGIVTDRDLVVKALTSNKEDNALSVEDCMSDDVFNANQNDRVVRVIREMGDHKVRRIPVVDKHDRLVGIVSMADIARHTDKDIELAQALEEVSKPSSWIDRFANLFK